MSFKPEILSKICHKSILLRVWGEDASASYLQMHHFTYSVGAFLAPLVVAPFYESSAEDLCDSENDQNGEISSKFYCISRRLFCFNEILSYSYKILDFKCI